MPVPSYNVIPPGGILFTPWCTLNEANAFQEECATKYIMVLDSCVSVTLDQLLDTLQPVASGVIQTSSYC